MGGKRLEYRGLKQNEWKKDEGRRLEDIHGKDRDREKKREKVREKERERGWGDWVEETRRETERGK